LPGILKKLTAFCSYSLANVYPEKHVFSIAYDLRGAANSIEVKLVSVVGKLNSVCHSALTVDVL